MEFHQAAALAGAVLLVVTLSARANLPAFLSLLLGTLFFGLAGNIAFLTIGNAFSLGFAQTVDSFGLVIIAGSVTAVFLERAGTVARLASDDRRHSRWRGVLAIAVGLVASLTSSATVALALLRPWCRVAGGSSARTRATSVATLALALSAGQAFIYPSVFAIATAAILKVKLLAILALGIPLAAVAAIAGWLFVSWMVPRVVADKPLPDTVSPSPPTLADKRSATPTDLRSLLVPTLVPLIVLIIAAFAEIPSEPLGRGLKEFLVFATTPTILLALSLGLALLMLWRWDKAVVSEQGWLGEAVVAAAKPLLVTATAGGFAALLQAAGMAELMAERMSELRLGVVVPFLAAAMSKLLQGSPLVATLTAAGMLEPLLPALGLGDPWGRACAAAAICAGTLIAQINDPYFWLVADVAALKPTQALAVHTLGTLVQAGVVILVLIAVRGLLV